MLLYSPAFKRTGRLETRSTFSDLGAAIADNFGVRLPENGSSFLPELRAMTE